MIIVTLFPHHDNNRRQTGLQLNECIIPPVNMDGISNVNTSENSQSQKHAVVEFVGQYARKFLKRG